MEQVTVMDSGGVDILVTVPSALAGADGRLRLAASAARSRAPRRSSASTPSSTAGKPCGTPSATGHCTHLPRVG
ncbi:hypothetical protein AB9128_06055 [Streptomyces cinereoruber]|uniref:hypothetical protein n=1 Tax=Streptomyces cinereoruber TaxID=67260 RepID=UPI003EBC9FE1